MFLIHLWHSSDLGTSGPIPSLSRMNAVKKKESRILPSQPYGTLPFHIHAASEENNSKCCRGISPAAEKMVTGHSMCCSHADIKEELFPRASKPYL